MRNSIKLTAGAAVLSIGLMLAGCDKSEPVTDDDTAVTDVDPGDANGTIDDTTVIDGTIGADDSMGMPADNMTADGAATDGMAPDEQPQTAPTTDQSTGE